MRWSSGRGRGAGRGLVAALLGLVLVVGIAACDGGGEDPTPPGTGSGSGSADSTTGPSDTEEPTATEEPSGDEVATPPELDEPELPEAATVDDRAGAAAFAEYYFAVMDYGFATGDIERLVQISSSDCDYCQARIAAIEQMAAEGVWIEGSDVEMSDVRVEFPQTGSTEYVVRFALDLGESYLHMPDGGVEVREAESHPRAALGATWTDGRFVLSGLDLDTDD